MELDARWGDLRQRIRQGAVLHQLEPFDSISCSFAKVVRLDADPTVRDPNCPEQAAGRDARADVVPLVSVRVRRRIKLTLIDIESDEAERPFVLAPVHADVLAAHESVVTVEQEGRRLSRLRIPAGAGAPDGRDAGGAAVVEDRARLLPRTEEGVVARTWREAARNVNWISA